MDVRVIVGVLVGVGVSVDVEVAVSVGVKDGVTVGMVVGSSPLPGPQEVRRMTRHKRSENRLVSILC